jgi:hypothetical protein
VTLLVSQIYTSPALPPILRAYCCTSSKLKYRSSTVINTADDSFSNPAQKIHKLKSTRYLNYRALTVENAIDKTESILILINTMNLQIEEILTSGQLHYRTFHSDSNKDSEC